MTSPCVVGLDVSLTGTGVAAVVDGHGWSTHVGEEAPRGATWPDRFDRIYRATGVILSAILAAHRYSPDLVVIEGPAVSKATGSVWDRAGLWHLVVVSLLDKGIPVAVVGPNLRIKWATGKGVGGKGTVLEAMTRRYGHVWTTFHGSDDETDAAALCAAGLWHLGHPLVPVPQSHADGLKTVDWPDVPGWPPALAVTE